jgi:23S rRNA (pseudouridine1915-N3)-methyltransferase
VTFRFSGKRKSSQINLKIFLYYVGKARDTHANAMAEEYIKRTTRYTKCEMREIQPRRFDPWTKHPDAKKVLLDPAGRLLDTAGFVRLVENGEREAQDLVFVIGGSNGLPPEWKPRADLLLGLTPMTLPHELARVMLAEQMYRALTTLRGHPYPR